MLFTIAFVCLIPPSWSIALAGRDKTALAEMGPDLSNVAKLLSQIGIDSLAIVLIGLVVIWTGYVNRVRWTWFVMFIIVWVWGFPFLVLPNLRYRHTLTLAGWIQATNVSVLARDTVEQVLIFSLMLIALILPIKSFFSKPSLQN